jgi:chaperonin GroES
MSTKKNKIRPLQDRIIVERLAPEEKTSGGIILPDSAQETPTRGRVLAVGKGKVREDGSVVPVDIKEGDEILFGKYSGVSVKVDGNEVLIMREDDVLGVVQ